jgi:hypothetical protein
VVLVIPPAMIGLVWAIRYFFWRRI